MPAVVETACVFSFPLTHRVRWSSKSFEIHTLGMSIINLETFRRYFVLPDTKERTAAKLFRPLFEFIDDDAEGALSVLIDSSRYWYLLNIADAPHLVAVIHCVALEAKASDLTTGEIFGLLDNSIVQLVLRLECPDIRVEYPPPELTFPNQMQRILSPSARALLPQAP